MHIVGSGLYIENRPIGRRRIGEELNHQHITSLRRVISIHDLCLRFEPLRSQLVISGPLRHGSEGQAPSGSERHARYQPTQERHARVRDCPLHHKRTDRGIETLPSVAPTLTPSSSYNGPAMKVLWIVLGVLGSLCLICGVGGYFVFNKGMTVINEAVTYGNDSVKAIGADWSIDEFERRAPKIVSTNGKEKMTQLMAIYKEKLGSQKGDVKGDVLKEGGIHAENNNGVSQVKGTWTADVQFENGPGHVTLEIVSHEGKWEIMNFQIQSDLLK